MEKIAASIIQQYEIIVRDKVGFDMFTKYGVLTYDSYEEFYTAKIIGDFLDNTICSAIIDVLQNNGIQLDWMNWVLFPGLVTVSFQTIENTSAEVMLDVLHAVRDLAGNEADVAASGKAPRSQTCKVWIRIPKLNELYEKSHAEFEKILDSLDMSNFNDEEKNYLKGLLAGHFK